MNLTEKFLESHSAKVQKLVNQSIDLERRRRQLAVETSELIEKINDLDAGIDRRLIEGWIHDLLEALR